MAEDNVKLAERRSITGRMTNMKRINKLMGIALSLMLVFVIAGCGNTAGSGTSLQEQF